jgi:hypothetical protein
MNIKADSSSTSTRKTAKMSKDIFLARFEFVTFLTTCRMKSIMMLKVNVHRAANLKRLLRTKLDEIIPGSVIKSNTPKSRSTFTTRKIDSSCMVLIPV